MTISSGAPRPLRTIVFARRDNAPFQGKFFVRGDQFEDFELHSSVGRIPQDVCDAVKTACGFFEASVPDAYNQAVAVLQTVSTDLVAAWPFGSVRLFVSR